MLEPFFLHWYFFSSQFYFTKKLCFNYKYTNNPVKKIGERDFVDFLLCIAFLEYWKIKELKCFDKMSRLLVNFLPIL